MLAVLLTCFINNSSLVHLSLSDTSPGNEMTTVQISVSMHVKFDDVAKDSKRVSCDNRLSNCLIVRFFGLCKFYNEACKGSIM